MAQGIANRTDHRCPDHIDILEPARGNGPGRSDDIGCANPPVIGNGPIDRPVKNLGKVVKYGNVEIRVGVGVGAGHVFLASSVAGRDQSGHSQKIARNEARP